jgi:serine/threonine protein kinase
LLAKGAVLAGRYVVLDEAGDSGMGVVYRALDRHRECAGAAEPWVALKVARPGPQGCSDTATNLRGEFLNLSELRHPNVVAVYDFGSEDGVEFMVLEWLQGETLAALLASLNSRRMALRTAEEIVRSVAAALAHAHSKGIVHGDVKPSNIFVTRDQTIKLLDFGASSRSTLDANDGDERGWATRAYASCDILQGKSPRPADDVFALGVTAYRLLSGARPFGELDALAARAQGLAPPDLPADAFASWQAVRNALQFDAMDRPPHAMEFLHQLENETDGVERESAFPHPVPAHVTAIAWGVLAALALGLSAWWSLSDAPSTVPEIERLLDDAAAAVSDGRLLEPSGMSAFTYYSAVLESDPDNQRANDGLDRLAEHYLTEARSSLVSEDFEEAIVNLDRARELRPDHFGIAAIEDLVGRYRRDLLVSARQSTDVDLDVAEMFLAQAAALSAEDDPQIAAVRGELLRERTSQEVEALIDTIDARILSERLLVPAGDSAIDLLRRASSLAPGDRQVQLARDRIASALLFQAMFSISNGNLEQASSFIEATKSLKLRHLALARAEYELAKARSNAVQTGQQ